MSLSSLLRAAIPTFPHLRSFDDALRGADGAPATVVIGTDDGASAQSGDSPRSIRSDEAAARSAFEAQATAESWQHELDAGRAPPRVGAMALRAAFTPPSESTYYIPPHPTPLHSPAIGALCASSSLWRSLRALPSIRSAAHTLPTRARCESALTCRQSRWIGTDDCG